MSFSRHFLSSVLLAGTVFAAATLPLVMLGSKPIAIQLEGKPVFTGQFKDLAGPYVGLSLALSIGTGIGNLGLLRWYQSARKLNLVEEQMVALKQQLNEKEALVESLKFSPTRLQATGLEHFLQDQAIVGRAQRAQLSSNGGAALEQQVYL
jgi:hypothetical protein